MGLMDSGDDLPEQQPRMRLPQPPFRPHIGVEVSRTRGEEEVGELVTPNHFMHSIHVGVPIHPVMGGQHGEPTRIVSYDLKT